MSLLRRRMMMMQEWKEADDNLIDMDAYKSISSGYFRQYIKVDTTKTYYMYEVNYANCYNSYDANLGLVSKDEYGKVTFKDKTVKIMVTISIGKNPYFGLTQRS